MKIKLFFCFGKSDDFEDSINEFIKDKQVVDIKLSISESESSEKTVALVLYKDKQVKNGSKS